MSSSVTITCKTLDNKDFTLTVSNMSSLASTYNNIVTKNKYSLPEKMNVVYYGDFVILCPNYTWGKNKIVPGNGGIYMYTQNFNGPITVKITVTSTEFPISIINNNYVVILSKTEYTPKIVDTEKIYLSKVSLTPDPKNPDIDFNYIMHLPNYKTFEANHDIVEISDIYDNTAYTIANICNKLAEINRTFSFDIISGTSFIFFFSMNFKKPKYMPILFTKSNKYKNMFTVDYLDKYFNYYPNHIAGKEIYTFVQIIDFTTTADTVNILILRQDSGRLVNAIFSPSKTPYTLYCPATDNLPQTFVGQTIKVDCPSGYSGYYKCEKEGVWENKYSNCQQIACEATDNFPRTIAGQTVTVSCPTGYTGNQTRYCNEDGKWSKTDLSTCKKNICTSEIYSGMSWPETIAGENVSISCPTGYTGSITRKCSESGVWENIYSNCQQIACEAADNFTRTIAGQTATKNCPSGYTGSVTRKCSESGVWEDEVNLCTLSVNNSEPSTSESVSEPNIIVSEPNMSESVSEPNIIVSEPNMSESVSESSTSESENNTIMIYIILIIIVVIVIIIIIITIRVKLQSKKEINRFRLK